jgi:hypothetical protein
LVQSLIALLLLHLAMGTYFFIEADFLSFVLMLLLIGFTIHVLIKIRANLVNTQSFTQDTDNFFGESSEYEREKALSEWRNMYSHPLIIKNSEIKANFHENRKKSVKKMGLS